VIGDDIVTLNPEIRRKPKQSYIQDRLVKTTSLFKKLFCWKL